MEVFVLEDSVSLGKSAAAYTANLISKIAAEKNEVRIVLSTGASQFETLEELVQQQIDWNKIEMFHLDEYINLSEEHPASFRRYLKERFVQKVSLKNMHFVNGEGDIRANIAELTREIRRKPVDIALIGIGENGHIAFNDPPADFETKESYKVVVLDEKCKLQQVGEGWFHSLDDVPSQAITMTVHQIMQSAAIVSAVPHQVKAKAIKDFFDNSVSPMLPATMLKRHPNFTLFLDRNSASEVQYDNKLHEVLQNVEENRRA